MDIEEARNMATTLNELAESYADLSLALDGTANEARATRKLWKQGNSSILIKLGVALILFPDPTISDIIGSALIAAGTVQQGIKRRTLHIEDVFKTFQNTFKELRDVQCEV